MKDLDALMLGVTQGIQTQIFEGRANDGAGNSNQVETIAGVALGGEGQIASVIDNLLLNNPNIDGV